MAYKCINCGKVKENGSKVYFVKRFDETLMKPTCCKECFEQSNKLVIMVLENRIKAIKNMILVEEIWKEK